MSQTDYTGQTPATSYHLYNPHGDTSALTDENGAVTASYRYDAFGNAINSASLTNGYTGKWQRDKDSVTGTIRMGAREYDPALGRFTSMDPLKGAPTDPQQRNRYAYATNNPLTRYDLNGLSVCGLR
ncbi:MAG: RHS repeat-associated core domain-containing protein [Actinobacteria bacterium]|nr:RHS repeat-associated core domain-containing protein [Actinomycetota bacterium]